MQNRLWYLDVVVQNRIKSYRLLCTQMYPHCTESLFEYRQAETLATLAQQICDTEQQQQRNQLVFHVPFSKNVTEKLFPNGLPAEYQDYLLHHDVVLKYNKIIEH